MLRIFRSIRQRLLAENRLTRYLIYALGEIILVVAGILIALQINNWNEYKKDRIQEKELLEQLRSEFASNLTQLDEKIAIRESIINACHKIIVCVDERNECSDDTVFESLNTIMITTTFDPITNDDLSSGRIHLIQNNQLKNRLALWTSEIVQVTEEEAVARDHITADYRPLLQSKGVMRNVIYQLEKNKSIQAFQLDNEDISVSIGPSKKEVTLDRLLDDPVFEGFLAFYAPYIQMVNSQSRSLRKRIVTILEMIDEELNKN